MEQKKMEINVKHEVIAQGANSNSTPDQLAFIRVVKNNLKKSDITFEPALGTPPTAQKANRLMQAMRQIVINNMAMPANTTWVINGQQLMDQIIATPEDSDELHLVLDYTEPTYQMYGTGHAVGGKSGSISNSKITANTVIIPYKISITGYSGAGDFNYDWIAAQEAIMPNFSITAGKISWSYASKYSSYDGYVDMYFWYGGVPK